MGGSWVTGLTVNLGARSSHTNTTSTKCCDEVELTPADPAIWVPADRTRPEILCILEDVGSDIAGRKLVVWPAGVGKAVVAESSKEDRWVGQALLDQRAFGGLGAGYKTLRADETGCAVKPILALKLATVGSLTG